jgi:trans-aconitate methyltransferase
MENVLDNHVRAYEGEIQYDFDNEIILNWYPRRVLNLAKGATAILELGLGHGYTTNIFSKHFSHHLVLEGSQAVINNFKGKYPDCNAKIVETYFEEFASDEKFDVIVMGFILEHVDNPNVILTHFRKFLTPTGKMFISVPNAEVLNRRLGNLMGMLPDMQALSENDHILGHKRYYTVKSLTEEIKNAGYGIERMEGIYLKPLTTNQMISLNLDKKVLEALCLVGIDYPELSCGILAQLKVIS